MVDELLSPKKVQAEFGLSESTIRRLRKAGKFPEPIKIGLRKIAWRRSDIEAWKEHATR